MSEYTSKELADCLGIEYLTAIEILTELQYYGVEKIGLKEHEPLYDVPGTIEILLRLTKMIAEDITHKTIQKIKDDEINRKCLTCCF